MLDEQFDHLDQEKERCLYCDAEIEEGLECEACKKNQHQKNRRSRVKSMEQCIATLNTELMILKGQLCKALGCGDPKCAVSTGICEHLTFGKGDLDQYGYWDDPCGECARAHEEIFPESGECWPFREEYRKKFVAAFEGKKDE